MSRLSELIQDLCPDGVDKRPLGELLAYTQPGPYLVSSKQYSPRFSTPVLTAGTTFLLGYSREIDGVYEASKSKPVIIFDDFTTDSKWVDFPFKLKSSAAKILTLANSQLADIRFLFYLLQTIRYQVGTHSRHWISRFAKMPVFCPPLEVQQEIVRILDQFTTLEAELEAELEARRKQYDHYRDVLIRSVSCESGNRRVQLRDLGSWVGGGTPSKERAEFWEGGCMPWVTPKDMGNSVVRDSQDHITETAVMGSSVRLVEAPSLAVVVRSSILQRTLPIAEVVVDATFNQDMKVLRVFDDYCRRYVFHVLQASSDRLLVECRKQGGSVNSLVTSRFLKSEIPIPPLERQRHIADTLDRFDALVNSISSGLPAEIAARRKQYEHYRDRLLSFPEKEA